MALCGVNPLTTPTSPTTLHVYGRNEPKVMINVHGKPVAFVLVEIKEEEVMRIHRIMGFSKEGDIPWASYAPCVPGGYDTFVGETNCCLALAYPLLKLACTLRRFGWTVEHETLWGWGGTPFQHRQIRL